MRIFTRRTTLCIGLALLPCATALYARVTDHRPNFALKALPAPGDTLPAFTLPMLGGGTLTARDLAAHPTVLAFWSSDCGVSRGALAGIDRVRKDYDARGVRTVLLADDGDTLLLRHILDSANVTLPVAYADGAMRALFDQSSEVPRSSEYRVRWALPGFVIVDAKGRVRYREVGVPLDEYRSHEARLTGLRSALDSLLGAY